MNKKKFTSHMWWALIEDVHQMCYRETEMACHSEEMACCVRGYHIYKDIWAAAIGEVLVYSREPTNVGDRCAIAILKSG